MKKVVVNKLQDQIEAVAPDDAVDDVLSKCTSDEVARFQEDLDVEDYDMVVILAMDDIQRLTDDEDIDLHDYIASARSLLDILDRYDRAGTHWFRYGGMRDGYQPIDSDDIPDIQDWLAEQKATDD